MDEPIRSTRGATALNGRIISLGWTTGGIVPADVRGNGARTGCAAGDNDGLATTTGRRSRAPRWRIFSIRSRLKMSAADISRVLSGLGM